MADPLRTLARLSNKAAEISAEDLERLADQQEHNLTEKQRLRKAMDQYNDAVAGGIVTEAELLSLLGLMNYLGLDTSHPASYWDDEDGNRYLDLNREGQQGAHNTETMEVLKRRIESAQENVEDDQQEIQFQIQVATGDMQNDRNVASQAMKRAEQMQAELRRNWNGN